MIQLKNSLGGSECQHLCYTPGDQLVLKNGVHLQVPVLNFSLIHPSFKGFALPV
jgi:hypothetical protein